jgi:hypothetical protein
MIVHLMTQRDQPYGSARKCCERCGVLVAGNKWFVDEEETFNDLPEGYVRCDRAPEENNHD